MLLVDIPLSNGYDLIGKKPRITRFRAIQPDDVQVEEPVAEESATEDPVVEVEVDVPPVVEEPIVEEVVEEPEDEPVVEEAPVVEEVAEKEPVKESAPETTIQTPKEPEILPEPEDIPVQEEKPSYYELEYDELPIGNAMDKLPESETGNYVIVYSSDNCVYCDKLISELKGNIGDYTLVVVHCTKVVRDPFYTRLVYQYFPNFLVIKNKVVKYYGSGYRSLEEFKKLL